jgi:HJR/Mrr/RecB family endonuclease
MGVAPQTKEVAELVERFTGQNQITTVQAARRVVSDASEELRRCRNARNRITMRYLCDGGMFWLIRLWKALVGWPGRFHVDPIVIMATVGTVVGFALGIICILALHATLIPTIIAAVVPPLGLLSLTRTLFRRTPAEVERIEERMGNVVQETRSARAEASASLLTATRALQNAKRLYAGVVRANEDPLVRLLNADIASMSGNDFENYLAAIFRYRGYQVEQTGQSGDQGVDLIVSLGAGPRVAVQAKCYGGSVSNKAVQEAYTGMAFYRCRGCVVVTSSYFTAGAREVAAATGCLLIDRSQIRDLIRGRIAI